MRLCAFARGQAEWGVFLAKAQSSQRFFSGPDSYFMAHITKLRLALFLALCLPLQAQAQIRSSQNSARNNNESSRWRPRIDSRVEFDSLARIYYQGRFYALPHLMFLIDRAAKEGAGDRVYYVNSKRYSFNGEFATRHYLTLDRGHEFIRRN